ncbi:NADP-dependent oxidoreductase [Dyadobacter sp. LHD-138]|uniref:NADP-dependent oxidoreductase n=1 Tax=Dyadobacter sp. LHD-138 TaxID=3071413 RepID=UPI0027E0407D|nr:NADP-dependent oxidoreductase [Dyadobacter sp. LHD-138]MDQ6479172.1 NADP-dependent oxidoreductase [Dyadobacter sp. LHD-138]
MKAIVLKDFGGVENLVEAVLDKPVVKENEVLVQVKAISINPVDVKTRAGKGMSGRLKEIDPLIIGWDISGVVVETGSAVTGFAAGDEVFGMVNFPGHGRAYAEYVTTPEAHLALKPANISHDEAAAATLAALTAYQALVSQAKIKAGDKVLVHSAAGGVGHYTVQIAKHLGAYVIGTSSAENKDFVLALGADEHIDYKNQKFEEVAKDIDFVLDTIGGENIDRSLEVVKKGGTLISIPSGLAESVTEKAKTKGINGFFFLVHSNGEDMKSIADLLSKGIIKSHVAKTFTFENLGQAHTQVETGKTRGKVVVTI